MALNTLLVVALGIGDVLSCIVFGTVFSDALELNAFDISATLCLMQNILR